MERNSFFISFKYFSSLTIYSNFNFYLFEKRGINLNGINTLLTQKPLLFNNNLLLVKITNSFVSHEVTTKLKMTTLIISFYFKPLT